VSADRRFALACGILLAAMLTNPAVGFAQTCEALPVDESSPYRYRFRANPPRCEGMYRSPVSGYRGMALVSLTFGRVTYDTGRDQYLEIKPQVGAAEKTLIRAVGVPERLYYRLEFELEPGGVFRLPLGDVVAPQKILPEAFGSYGMRKLPGGQIAFLPVYAHAPGAAGQAEVVAVVRPGADVSAVRWRWYAPDVSPTDWMPVAQASGLVPEGKRLEIVLGREIARQMTLEVSFLSQGIDRADRFVLLAR